MVPRLIRSGEGAGLVVRARRSGREVFVVFTSIEGVGRAAYIVPPVPSPYCLRVGLREARFISSLLGANYASLCRVASILYRDSVRETLRVLVEYGLLDWAEEF